LSIERTGPFVSWEQVSKPRRAGLAEYYLGIEIGGVDLSDELPAPSTWRKNMQRTLIVAIDSNDLRDLVFTTCDHGRDGCVLSAEPVPELVSMHTPE
jgi:hypothetical protein